MSDNQQNGLIKSKNRKNLPQIFAQGDKKY